MLSFLAIISCSSQPAFEQAIVPISNPTDLSSLTAHSNKPFIGQPQPENYSICLHNTCGEIAFVSLSDQQWQNIKSIFYPKSHSAEQERQQIKQAISLFEIYTGEQTGTHQDRAENDMRYGISGQMDCIDEATNTTVYLRILQNANLLLWHTQASRMQRGLLSGNTPHNTATMIETRNKQRYAVDSWFEINGKQPYIIPFEQWMSGWSPN
jgi:hypothetical protein